jgi:hypothetical protein
VGLEVGFAISAGSSVVSSEEGVVVGELLSRTEGVSVGCCACADGWLDAPATSAGPEVGTGTADGWADTITLGELLDDSAKSTGLEVGRSSLGSKQ